MEKKEVTAIIRENSLLSPRERYAKISNIAIRMEAIIGGQLADEFGDSTSWDERNEWIFNAAEGFHDDNAELYQQFDAWCEKLEEAAYHLFNTKRFEHAKFKPGDMVYTTNKGRIVKILIQSQFWCDGMVYQTDLFDEVNEDELFATPQELMTVLQKQATQIRS